MENMTECDFETLDKCPWGEINLRWSFYIKILWDVR